MLMQAPPAGQLLLLMSGSCSRKALGRTRDGDSLARISFKDLPRMRACLKPPHRRGMQSVMQRTIQTYFPEPTWQCWRRGVFKAK